MRTSKSLILETNSSITQSICFILLCIQGVINFAIEILVAEIFFPFNCYFSANRTRENFHVFSFRPCCWTEWRVRPFVAGKEKTRVLSGFTGDPSNLREYSRFPQCANPFTDLPSKRRPESKTRKFNGDGDSGGVWLRAQINSRRNVCTWQLRNDMKSFLLQALLPRVQLYVASFQYMRK